jgi:biopolymer transport protein ExbB
MRIQLRHFIAASLFFGLSLPVPAASINMDDLLKQVQSGRVSDARENADRLKAFKAEKSLQRKKLADMRGEQKRQERRSTELEKEFQLNEEKLIKLEQTLRTRLGSLKELFGVIQQSAGDASGQFESSLTHLQYPDRGTFLTELAQKMGQTNQLATIEEIEKLWFELQREMTESAKVVRFPAKVITSLGEEENRPVIRVGLFNVISGGKYLQFVPETGNLVELGRQPQGRYLSRVANLEQANEGLTAFAVDPSRGQLLSLLVQSPSLIERIHQGGVVGYIILALGAVALLVALERILVLWLTGVRVRSQIKNTGEPKENNPLGRVLKIYEGNPSANTESLELRLAEGVLKETKGINRSLAFLKVIAVVAPLMGLLGTVTGMIVTFQAITLFGTGDPKLMAGGISQALVTTVLGLCVAIPTVFMHTLASSRARRLTQVLEEQATGMVATRSESVA